MKTFVAPKRALRIYTALNVDAQFLRDLQFSDTNHIRSKRSCSVASAAVVAVAGAVQAFQTVPPDLGRPVE